MMKFKRRKNICTHFTYVVIYASNKRYIIVNDLHVINNLFRCFSYAKERTLRCSHTLDIQVLQEINYNYCLNIITS